MATKNTHRLQRSINQGNINANNGNINIVVLKNHNNQQNA